MIIRTAQKKDCKRILELLGQVLDLHAEIRPDIFIAGTTKYTEGELEKMLTDGFRRIFVAVDEYDSVLGYAFCEIREQPFSNNMVPFKTIFIDDLCVDKNVRSSGVGTALFERVKDEAKRLGCYEITLNVWEGNDSARRFYDKLGMKVKESRLELIL